MTRCDEAWGGGTMLGPQWLPSAPFPHTPSPLPFPTPLLQVGPHLLGHDCASAVGLLGLRAQPHGRRYGILPLVVGDEQLAGAVHPDAAGVNISVRRHPPSLGPCTLTLQVIRSWKMCDRCGKTCPPLRVQRRPRSYPVSSSPHLPTLISTQSVGNLVLTNFLLEPVWTSASAPSWPMYPSWPGFSGLAQVPAPPAVRNVCVYRLCERCHHTSHRSSL